ncbi:hypothetical protein OKW21_004221 [Catalinimonas alkaloidigena]|uniref:hypothetical protein n=1 Tax=Catalinimonas alkaloidigena TaxID=1075417 RepID=UPI002406DAEE|nr:hypothetical protein [Catalinimonas alkaloidigena]MDF9798958.1 hypothetical protein [Catalinimonas alkaloidigena]
MKTLHVLFIAFTVLVASTAYAQVYRPVEKKVEMGKHMVDAWVMQVDEPMDPLKKSYKKFAKRQLNVKVKKSGRDLLMAEEVLIPGIAQKEGDLKARFFTEGGETTLAVAFLLGYDIGLNSLDYPQEMSNLRSFTKNFVKHYKTEKLNALIEADEQQEKRLKSTLKKNEKEYKNLGKRVPKVEELIASEKTKEEKKITLKNENVSNRSRLIALDEIIENLKKELMLLNKNIEQHRSAISMLELQFADDVVPMVNQ